MRVGRGGDRGRSGEIGELDELTLRGRSWEIGELDDAGWCAGWSSEGIGTQHVCAANV